MRIDLDNQTDCLVDADFLESIAQKLTSKEIELIITDNDEIQQINKQYRNIDKPTDVLSFPLEDQPHVGTIMISSEYAQAKANEFAHSLQDEISLLFIHGLLHCLGYDHEVDNGEHRNKESELIKEFDLPESLIVRTEG